MPQMKFRQIDTNVEGDIIYNVDDKYKLYVKNDTPHFCTCMAYKVQKAPKDPCKHMLNFAFRNNTGITVGGQKAAPLNKTLSTQPKTMEVHTIRKISLEE